jgi:hypothetical protein
MAGRTADPLLDVNAVIEENEIGQLIDTRPLDRLLRRQALPHRRENRRILPYLRMTGHAGFGRRQSGKRGFLDRGMAITAVEAETRDVMLMTERDRLRQRHVLLGGIRRTINGINDTPKSEEPEEYSQQRHASDAVAAFSKNLRHVPVCPAPACELHSGSRPANTRSCVSYPRGEEPKRLVILDLPVRTEIGCLPRGRAYGRAGRKPGQTR